MTDTKHTPTPWSADGNIIYAGGMALIASGQQRDLGLRAAEDNAAHIVKCVNMHEELVRQNQIMKEALDVVADHDAGSTAGLAFTAKEALKKAGAL